MLVKLPYELSSAAVQQRHEGAGGTVPAGCHQQPSNCWVATKDAMKQRGFARQHVNKEQTSTRFLGVVLSACKLQLPDDMHVCKCA
jgi:hypothetical protein